MANRLAQLEKGITQNRLSFLESPSDALGSSQLPGAVTIGTEQDNQQINRLADLESQIAPKERRGGNLRADGTEKGLGFFGELQRPDGNVSTELSIGVGFDGQETEIPTLVPTLTRTEVDSLLAGGEITEEITQKAIKHAQSRFKQGKGAFAEEGEQIGTPKQDDEIDAIFKTPSVATGSTAILDPPTAQITGVQQTAPVRNEAITLETPTLTIEPDVIKGQAFKEPVISPEQSILSNLKQIGERTPDQRESLIRTPESINEVQISLREVPFTQFGQRERKEEGDFAGDKQFNELTGRLWTGDELASAKEIMVKNRDQFTDEDFISLRRAEAALHPFRALPDQIKTVITKGISLPFGWGELLAPGLQQDLDAELREIPGIVGEAGAQAAAEGIDTYIKWVHIFPAIFKALGLTSKIPGVQKGTKALKDATGFSKLESVLPRTAKAISTTLAAGTKGATVGAGVTGITAFNNGMSWEEAKPLVIRDAVLMASVASIFNIAGAIDTQIYVRRLRSGMIKANNQKFEAFLNEANKLSGKQKTDAIKGLVSQKRIDLQAIDGIVSEVESTLTGIKSGKLFQKGQEQFEGPTQAAARFVQEGTRPTQSIKGIKELEVGIGKGKKPILSNTKIGEIIETVQQSAKGIKQELAFGAKPTPTPPPLISKVPTTVNQIFETKDIKTPETVEEIFAEPKAEAKPVEGKVEGKKLFHHSVSDIKTFNPTDAGVWFNDNPVGFSRRPNAKFANEVIIDVDNLNLANKKQATEAGLFRGDQKKLAENLKEQGFDGIKMTVDQETHFLIFDVENIQDSTPKAEVKEIELAEEPSEVIEKINVKEAKTGIAEIKKRFEKIKVTPIQPPKIVSPAEAGPESITFAATKQLQATKLIEDPKLRKQAQGFESKIAKLKTKIVQAKADKKVDIANTLIKQREITERKLSTLKEKVQLREAAAKNSIQTAKQLRQDIRKFSKEALTPTQKDIIITQLAKVGPERRIETNQKALEKVIDDVERFVASNEKKQSVGVLNKRIKKIKQKLKKPPLKGGFNQKQSKQLQTLIDSFDIKNTSQTTQDRVIGVAEKTRKFLASIREQTESEFGEAFAELKIPKSTLDILNADTKTQRASLLTTEGVNSIVDEINRLEHLSDTINTIKIGKKRRLAKEIEAEAVEHIDLNVVDKSKNDSTAKQEKEKGLVRSSVNISIGIDNYATFRLFNTISGGQRSVITKIGEEEYQQGISDMNQFKQDVVVELREELKKAGLTIKDLAKLSPAFDPRFNIQKKLIKKTPTVKIELNGKPFEFTQANLMDIFLSAKQPKGLKHLTERGIVFGKDKTQSGPLSIEDIDRLASNLTKEARKAAKILTKIGDGTQKDGINKTSQELDGQDKAKVSNYWHLETFSDKKLKGQFGISLLENQGFLQERTGGTRKLIVRDAFIKFEAQANSVAEYVGMSKPLRSLKFLVNNDAFIDSVKKKGYEDERRIIIKLIERAEGSTPERVDAVGQLFQKVFNGVVRAVIPVNPRVVASQFTSSIGYLTEIDPKFNRIATRPFITPKRLRAAVDISPTLWERVRMGHSSVELAELGLTDSTLKMFSGKSKNINKVNVGIKLSDAAAMLNGIDIAKAEIKSKKLRSGSQDYWGQRGGDKFRRSLKPGSEEWKTEVRKRAEFLWLRTQPSWDKWNGSLNTTTKGIGKPFLLFRSYFVKTISMINDANVRYSNDIARINSSDLGILKKAGEKTKTRAEWSKRVGAVLMSMSANAILRVMITAFIVGELPDMQKLIAEAVSAPFSMMALFGRFLQASTSNFLSSVLGSKAKKNFTGDGISALPISIMNDMLRIGDTFTKAAANFINGDTEKAEKQVKSGLKQTWRTVGLYYGIPTFLIKQILSRFETEEKSSGFGKI